MKRFSFYALFFYFLSGAGILLAGQILLFNNTGKKIAFSLKFFHKQAQEKMVIEDFQLNPREKTAFPQSKDLHVAAPLKLKIRRPDDWLTADKSFDQDDTQTHDLEVTEYNGKLKVAKRKPDTQPL